MRKVRATFIDKIVRFIAIILAISLFLGSIAGHVDPRDFRIIAFFGLSYPFFLLLNIFMKH